jgi:hypothetical protein
MEWLTDFLASALHALLYPFFWIWAYLKSGITVGKFFSLLFAAFSLALGLYFFGFWKTMIICAAVLLIPRLLFPKLYAGQD